MKSERAKRYLKRKRVEVDVIDVSLGASKSNKVELIAGEQQLGETVKAMIACNDYLRMGPNRSIAGLHRYYLHIAKRSPEDHNQAPTTSLRTLRNWSSDYDWSVRAEIIDAKAEYAKNEIMQRVLGTGLALSHNRILILKKLAQTLALELDSNLWVDDVKVVGFGKYAEKVELKRFNAQLVEQFRNVLDDLAKETGGRKQRTEIANPDNETFNIGITNVDEYRSKLADRFEQIANETAEKSDS